MLEMVVGTLWNYGTCEHKLLLRTRELAVIRAKVSFGHSQLPDFNEKGIENRFPVNVLATAVAPGSKCLLSARESCNTFN